MTSSLVVMQELGAGPGYYALWPTGALSELWGVLAGAFYSQVRLMAETDESAGAIVQAGPDSQHVLHENPEADARATGRLSCTLASERLDVPAACVVAICDSLWGLHIRDPDT